MWPLIYCKGSYGHPPNTADSIANDRSMTEWTWSIVLQIHMNTPSNDPTQPFIWGQEDCLLLFETLKASLVTQVCWVMTPVGNKTKMNQEDLNWPGSPSFISVHSSAPYWKVSASHGAESRRWPYSSPAPGTKVKEWHTPVVLPSALESLLSPGM